MSDRYYGSFEVLKSDIERYPELKEAIETEFYWEGKLYNKDNWEEDSPVAHFCNEEARYGHFEELEDLCEKLHVPYDGWSAAYEDDSITRHYRPDENNGKIIYKNGDDENTYSEGFLRGIIKKANINKSDPDYEHKAGKAFLSFLDSIPKIKPLEDYEGYIHKTK